MPNQESYRTKGDTLSRRRNVRRGRSLRMMVFVMDQCKQQQLKRNKDNQNGRKQQLKRNNNNQKYGTRVLVDPGDVGSLVALGGLFARREWRASLPYA
eukprot:scaffold6480_cov90-Alexandrium_tamarense.AAC.1